MSKFYADPKLGIKNDIDEEGSTNNAGSGAVAMPPDAVKKKKKNPYDGRTKEARAFYKRMAERKSSNENQNWQRKFKSPLWNERQF